MPVPAGAPQDKAAASFRTNGPPGRALLSPRNCGGRALVNAAGQTKKTGPENLS